MTFELTDAPIDTAGLSRALASPHSGGFVSFEGWVRDHHEGREVAALRYEAYDILARSEGQAIVDEARAQFDIDAAHCVHRLGDLAVGDCAVWVGVAAAHRDAAFAACRYIIDTIKARVPIWKHEHYTDGTAEWVGCHGCHVHAQADRYARQSVLPGFGAEGQRRLADARVLIVGLGALGCPVADYLAGAGVGSLTLVDPDHVDLSNLHRQTLYTEADRGRAKAEAAAQRLRARNSEVRVDPHVLAFGADTAAALLAGCDLVIDCTDRAATKQRVSVAARAAGVPWIIAGIHRYDGGVYVAPPALDDGVCWACIGGMGGQDCATTGVLGPVPGVIGAAAAAEAIRRLVGQPSAWAGQWTVLDLHGARLNGFAPRRRPHCDCSVPVAEHDHLDPALVWLDLRGSDERAELPLPEATAVGGDALLAAPQDWIDAAKTYLLVCASGTRSARAAQALHDAGVRNVRSLAGGLAAVTDEACGA